MNKLFWMLDLEAPFLSKKALKNEAKKLQDALSSQCAEHRQEIHLLKEKHRADVMGYQAKINCMEAAHKAEIERLKSEYSAAGKISELAYEVIHELRKEIQL